MGMFLFVGGESYGTGQTLLYSVHGGGCRQMRPFAVSWPALGMSPGMVSRDLAVGSRDTGRVVVFRGADGRRLRTLWSPGGTVIRARALASALASLGDVTGDGIADLAVGVPLQDLAAGGR